MTSSTVEQRAHALRVSRVVRETADALSIVLDMPADARSEFTYSPGQFLTVRIPHETGAIARCYSLSSAPAVDTDLQITVKRTQHGYASNWICDNIEPGSSLLSLHPAGMFSPRRWDADLVLVAAGSGITPIMSILKTALACHSNRVVLIYANRDIRDVIFHNEITQLEARYSHRLDVIHWLDSVDGPPIREKLADRIAAVPPSAHAYLCGPAEFMKVAETVLLGCGVSAASIHREVFASLPTDPFAPPRSPFRPTTSLTEASQQATRVRAEIDGETHTIDWPRGEVLLDALLSENLDAPYVCREGNCGACAFTLREGEVEMLCNDTLDDYDLEKGLRLACQSVALTDTVSIAFDQ